MSHTFDVSNHLSTCTFSSKLLCKYVWIAINMFCNYNNNESIAAAEYNCTLQFHYTLPNWWMNTSVVHIAYYKARTIEQFIPSPQYCIFSFRIFQCVRSFAFCRRSSSRSHVRACSRLPARGANFIRHSIRARTILHLAAPCSCLPMVYANANPYTCPLHKARGHTIQQTYTSKPPSRFAVRVQSINCDA